MPEAIPQPHKRVLADATKSRSNLQLSSPAAAKKRKLDGEKLAPPVKPIPHNGFRKPPTPASSQSLQKSQFVEEVLEKMTQDINGLKDSNAEKDQQWERPPVVGFDQTRDSLCFQQIEAEEGMLLGKTVVRLFGVTEV
jgi:DNA polymerase delta subunit 1